MTRAKLSAGILALGMGLSLLAADPATAGSVTFTVKPKGEDARVLRDGFRIYSIFSSLKKNSVKVDQKGNGNTAAVAQSGSGNRTQVVQRGNGHSTNVTQSGNGNLLGVFQFGRNTHYSGSQNGGDFGLVFQGGW